MKKLDKIKKFCYDNRYEIATGAKLTICATGALFGAYKLGTLDGAANATRQTADLVAHGAVFKHLVKTAHHTDQAAHFVWTFPDHAEAITFSIQQVK